MFAFEFGFAGFGFDFSHDFGLGIDDEASAVVDDVFADGAAVDDFGAFSDDEMALDDAEDVDSSAVFDGDVAVDCAADVEFSAVDDGDIAGDRAPELDGFGDDLIAGEATAFFPHGECFTGRGGESEEGGIRVISQRMPTSGHVNSGNAGDFYLVWFCNNLNSNGDHHEARVFNWS